MQFRTDCPCDCKVIRRDDTSVITTTHFDSYAKNLMALWACVGDGGGGERVGGGQIVHRCIVVIIAGFTHAVRSAHAGGGRGQNL